MQTPKYTIEQRTDLPSDAGVYKFFDDADKLIYVGKAKNIKKRVSSYFNKSHNLNRKTKKLISEIESIECIIANTEFDALLLENNLIKENQPKYNILLKDDKTFPYICVVNERFPRVISTRKFDPTQGAYFGPYSSVIAMKNVLDLLRKLYSIRTCKLNLSEKNIANKKFKVCLEYHIGNCKGPCEALQTEEEYNAEIDQVKHILKGNLSLVKNYFKDAMQTHAEALEYELAHRFKEKLDLLDKFQVKSTVVNPKISDLDVFTIVSENSKAFVNYLNIKNGSIISSQTVELKKKLDESDEEAIKFAAIQLREIQGSENRTVLSNKEFELSEEIEIIVPSIGDKKKLIDFSLRNAIEYKHKKVKASPKEKVNEAVAQLQKDLKLTEVPNHIECFDNSNLQGTNPVASMVCFKKGKPSKKDYRHFNIKTVEGPDDYASMKEIVFRRYKRLSEENEPLPHLIVIDGGKGQLSSACQALKELQLYGSIPIIGIAKRLEEIYFPEDSIPLHINKKSLSLRLLQHLRDEAHRFAITFHRLKRSNASFNTELEAIPGIGKSTTDLLLKSYKSVKKIKSASEQELADIVGHSKAAKLIAYFNKKRG